VIAVTSVREFFGFCSVRLSAATQIDQPSRILSDFHVTAITDDTLMSQRARGPLSRNRMATIPPVTAMPIGVLAAPQGGRLRLRALERRPFTAASPALTTSEAVRGRVLRVPHYDSSRVGNSRAPWNTVSTCAVSFTRR